jgi:hypothetical protein
MLQQNTSFGGIDPLTPILNVPIGVVRAQAFLFTSLSITLFAAFIAVLGKRWILYYTRATTWGNIVDRGKERQAKLMGLEKWGLHLVMELLPNMLQFALFLLGAALAVYLWDLDVSLAEVVLVVNSAGLIFYTCITLAATVYSDCPFQTPFSILLPKVLPWAKDFTTLARVWLRRRAISLLFQIESVTEPGFLKTSAKRVLKTFTGGANIPNDVGEDPPNNDHPVTLSNPEFWRNDPLFTYSGQEDTITVSAAVWLLENSTDFSAASAVAAAFSELQWTSQHRSTPALIRLRNTYEECFRAPELTKSARLKALQSAAAYYVLCHNQLIWSASNSLELEVWKLALDLPCDLFHLSSGAWGGNGVFEHLLRTEDRSGPVTSAQFLSYIAPYWFCGDSDSTVKSRQDRLPTLYELIEVLEKSDMLNEATLTDCVLCAGAAMDFPLHPEDLIRVDKRCVPFPLCVNSRTD